ncbi:MAG: DUF6287 domain-containing protein [Streptococcus sp.]
MPLLIVVLAQRQTQTSSTSLKPDELKNGNYKSAVGTWKSSNGKTITITSDGSWISGAILILSTKSHPINMCLAYIPNLC